MTGFVESRTRPEEDLERTQEAWEGSVSRTSFLRPSSSFPAPPFPKKVLGIPRRIGKDTKREGGKERKRLWQKKKRSPLSSSPNVCISHQFSSLTAYRWSSTPPFSSFVIYLNCDISRKREKSTRRGSPLPIPPPPIVKPPSFPKDPPKNPFPPSPSLPPLSGAPVSGMIIGPSSPPPSSSPSALPRQPETQRFVAAAAAAAAAAAPHSVVVVRRKGVLQSGKYIPATVSGGGGEGRRRGKETNECPPLPLLSRRRP